MEKKKLFVLTGFLGAGKTSFLQHVLEAFSDKKLEKSGLTEAFCKNRGFQSKKSIEVPFFAPAFSCPLWKPWRSLRRAMRSLFLWKAQDSRIRPISWIF